MIESQCISISPDNLDELFSFCNPGQRSNIKKYGMDKECRILVYRLIREGQSKTGVWVFPSDTSTLPTELFDRYAETYDKMKSTLAVDGTPINDVNYIENTAMTLLDIFSHPAEWNVQKDVAAIAGCAYNILMKHAAKYNPETLDANIVCLQLNSDTNGLTHSFINFTNRTASPNLQ